MDGRTLAPFGRRFVPVHRNAIVGAYAHLCCFDRKGPRPQPGQFYMLATKELWGGEEGERPFLPRAFSVMRASPPGPVELEFLLDDVGPGTHRLRRLHEGEVLAIAGPFGVGFKEPREGRRPILVGGGIGVAPLLIWQDQLGAGGIPSPALLGFRDHRYAHVAGMFAAARVATDDGSVGHHGLVTELLAQELDRDDHAEVYACGPPPMLEAVRALCAERQVPAQLALESGMACGFGACFGCVVPTRNGLVRLCLEGPVLDAADLEAVA
jgi:dihydroorotate dehydrogenase electron transfer subunit